MADGSFNRDYHNIIRAYASLGVHHTVTTSAVCRKISFFFLVVHVLVLFAYLTIPYGTSAIYLYVYNNTSGSATEW